jgi:hypothetical protein
VPVAAAITSPTPSTALSSSSVNFIWTGGVNVAEYELEIGTTGVGSSNVYYSGPVTGTSENVTVPTNGATLYVRLRQLINNAWQSTDYTYTEAAATPAALTTPTPGTALTAASTQFSWTAGTGVAEYELEVGTTGVGSSNVYYSGPVTATSEVVNVPAAGGTLYVRLRQLIGGAWQPSDYTYTVPAAAITTPTPGTTLTGTSVQFGWTASAPGTQFELEVGNTGVGSSNTYYSGPVTVTSETVTVPSNGATLYVRLRQLINGTWQSSDYIYTVPW